jgi:superfamily II DNA or RNA helicase
MLTKLYPTQVRAIDRHASGDDIPNWSEAGTGKTNTALGLVERLGFQQGLVVCPPIAATMWKQKLEEELGAKAQWLATGSTKIDKTADFLIVTYGLADKFLPELIDRENDILILDEAHRLQNPDSIRTGAIFGPKCDGEDGLYETSRYCLSMTGTPMERYADGLWSQLRATQPDVLNKYKALSLAEFRRQFCIMEKKVYNGVARRVCTRNQNFKLLNKILYSEIGIVRDTIAEVAPYMPPVMLRDIYVESKLSAELRAAMKGKSADDLDRLLTSGEGATACRALGLSKIKDMVSYILAEAHSNQLLIGYWHTDVGNALVDAISSNTVTEMISGATTARLREAIKERFIAGDTNVIVGQIAAMGEAMDGLQKSGRRVIFAEDHWSSSKVEQFYKRLYRNGQHGAVQVDFMKSNNPIDNALTRVRLRKESSATLILSQANL